jgi:Protein NO VEIN, C-terminal/Helicase conserved C-terminal domain
VRLRKVLSDNNVFNDPKMKLLIFTEHKDTLDYLAGDGKDGRPLGKLRQWSLKTTQIHGGMKIGDRDALTRYVEDQSIKASEDDSARGRALSFTMAMLQRRFASSVYAVRRSLERMRDKRQKILADPEKYRKEQIEDRLPDDFDDLPEDEQMEIEARLEGVVASIDPIALREEIQRLGKLVEHARSLEGRETPGTRIQAEREFRDDAQILVATEAAGEGINLQFCWFMVNYDIPWNPVRLEQRMGRIHRYGQEHDCLIFNFVALNTREGRVLAKLLERLLEIRSELGTDQVFDVVGEVFPANLLEKLFRELYVRRTDLSNIEARIVRDVDPERFRKITSSTLEGLAKRELNLGALLGKSAEARERRLIPEVIEDFFTTAGPVAGVHPKPVQKDGHVFRIGKIPRTLQPIGERLEPRFGRLGREYQKIVFDKALLPTDPTLEWVTPGHPLFEAVRDDVAERVRDDLKRGAVFYDLQAKAPVRLDAFGASVKDGRGNTVSRRLFIVQADVSGVLTIRQPTYLAELAFAPIATPLPSDSCMPDRAGVEQTLVEKALNPFLEEIAIQRAREVETIAQHLEISLGELIHRANMSLAELANRRIEGENIPGLEGNIAQAEAHLDELNNRLERRRVELAMERHLAIGDIEHLGCAWVLPHPERTSPSIAPMVRDEEIERIAVQEVIRHETERGWVIESVEKDNRGFDIISRKPHPHDEKTFTEVRFIEVKGRAAVGEVALSDNEYKTADRLKKDYWLYVAFNCGTKPELHFINDPARLGWQPVVQVAHYHLGSQAILNGETQ